MTGLCTPKATRRIFESIVPPTVPPPGTTSHDASMRWLIPRSKLPGTNRRASSLVTVKSHLSVTAPSMESSNLNSASVRPARLSWTLPPPPRIVTATWPLPPFLLLLVRPSMRPAARLGRPAWPGTIYRLHPNVLQVLPPPTSTRFTADLPI